MVHDASSVPKGAAPLAEMARLVERDQEEVQREEAGQCYGIEHLKTRAS